MEHSMEQISKTFVSNLRRQHYNNTTAAIAIAIQNI
jgi:hypothetical protein